MRDGRFQEIETEHIKYRSTSDNEVAKLKVLRVVHIHAVLTRARRAISSKRASGRITVKLR